MKLSKSELKLVAGLRQHRRQKLIGLATVALVLVVYWILRYAEVLRPIDLPLDSLLIIYFGFLAGDTFSSLSTESRQVELLHRYVNNDAEAIAALSELE